MARNDMATLTHLTGNGKHIEKHALKTCIVSTSSRQVVSNCKRRKPKKTKKEDGNDILTETDN